MEQTGGSYTEWGGEGPVTYTIGWSITGGAFWIGPNGVVVGSEWATEAGLPALPGPGNFSIPLSFAQTVQAFGNAGIAPSPLDNRLNLFHGTDFNLRDFSSVCSAHVLLNVNSGQSPGQPTTGSMHFDMLNPASNIPLYPFSPEGSQAMFISLHGLVDLAPWLVSLGTGVSLPSAGSLCQ